ncbi:putative drug exporter of the RND superfamily [Streptomyces sp. 1222.5]|uniref:MMPL family transporter n=1 Tax=unclassified Streptomyces TaxID=2593676 RepID=UPI00089CC040|nr:MULTISPECIES: MMPL family transporter [unclassified Streptomyces]PKW05609.1 RND superfamily putative drug exporter [Streptomyces sp. 5112.2]SED34123.1 putative drug exporter of the RND superfamily [Streptomyces sp. 1222.5]
MPRSSPHLPAPAEAPAGPRPPAGPAPAPGGLGRLGAFCARHPAAVIAGWLLVLAAALAGRHLAAPTFSDQVSLPGTASHTGADLLARSLPDAGRPNGKVVFHTGSGTVGDRRSAVDRTVAELRDLPHVTAASALVTSDDGRTAYTTVSFDEQLKSLGHDYTARLDEATAPARAAGLGVAYGGDLEQVVREPADDKLSEGVGVATALVILLLAFGSVLAALLPLVTALISVGVGLGIVGVVAATLSLATSATTLAGMIGLGVGIDYALFLTTRFRQDLVEGRDPVEAAARTAHTSGRAVLIAALTVAVAMLSLYACGLTFIGKIGLAATLAVVVTAAAALTLVPAALGLVGRRIDRLRVRRPVAESTGARDGWHRYAGLVSRRPWTFLVVGLTVLGLCSVPLLSMRLGHVDAGADRAGSSTRTAYDWIAHADGPGFGPGANGPVLVVVDVSRATTPADRISQDLTAALRGTPGVASVSPVRASPDGKVLATTVTPATGPQDQETGALLDTLSGRTLPKALDGTGAKACPTGSVAGQADFRATIGERLPLVIGIVLVLAFLLLTTVFRSVVIPLKAVVLNLLTTAASYGVLVAVFQWGWGDSLLGLSEPVPIESYVPMMMFAIVFGLSMDYEIFLLSRIAEAWNRTGDNRLSVGEGLSSTARVISAAAFIMTAVFLSFTASPTVVVKMLALGLAISVIVDATVVRLVLVPSAMFLMGRANWWIPRRLDRLLPHVHA